MNDASATLCYGILYPDTDNYQFIWDELGLDIVDWWIYEVNNYVSPYGYNHHSKYEDIKHIYKEAKEHKDKCLRQHSLPISIILHGYSNGYEQQIIAVKKYETATDENAIEISNSVIVSDEEHNILIDFCQKYCPLDILQPKWYLTVHCT